MLPHRFPVLHSRRADCGGHESKASCAITHAGRLKPAARSGHGPAPARSGSRRLPQVAEGLMRPLRNIGRQLQPNATTRTDSGYGSPRHTMDTCHFTTAAHEAGRRIAMPYTRNAVPDLHDKSHPCPEEEEQAQKQRCERKTNSGQENDHQRIPGSRVSSGGGRVQPSAFAALLSNPIRQTSTREIISRRSAGLKEPAGSRAAQGARGAPRHQQGAGVNPQPRSPDQARIPGELRCPWHNRRPAEFFRLPRREFQGWQDRRCVWSHQCENRKYTFCSPSWRMLLVLTASFRWLSDEGCRCHFSQSIFNLAAHQPLLRRALQKFRVASIQWKSHKSLKRGVAEGNAVRPIPRAGFEASP